YYYTDPVSGAPGQLRIQYTPPGPLNMFNLGSTALPSPYYGTFTVSRPVGSGAVITSNNRFEIVVHMTYPYDATKTIRGWIKTTTAPTDLPRIIFDSQTLTLAGSAMTLDFSSTSWVSPTVINYDATNPHALVGYDAGTVLGANIIKGTMTSPEPI